MNSDLSDVEIECSFHLKQTVDFTNFKIQKMMQLLDLPEARTCHSPAKRDENYKTKETQTTFAQNESRESSTMTETVSYQNFGGMADIIASDRMIVHQNVEHFPENAFDAILCMLSIVIFRRQIEIMLNESEIDRMQILKSLKCGSRKIYKAIFNEPKKLFVLLISTEDEQLLLEMFSLTNLLKRSFVNLGKMLTGKGYQLMSLYDLLFVSYEKKIAIISLTTLKVLKKVKEDNIVSIVFPKRSSYLFVTKDGEFLDEKLERVSYLSPLMSPILNCFSFNLNKSNDLMIINEKMIYFTNMTSLTDYKCIFLTKEFLENITSIVPLTQANYCIFNKKIQKCCIIDISSRKISHELQFKRNEYTVDIHSYEGILYSLTSSGILSKWKILPNGKLRRDQTIILNLSYCKKLVYKSNKHIVLQTISKLHLIPLFYNVIHIDSFGEELPVQIGKIVILVYDIHMNPSCSNGTVNVVLPGYFHIISGEVINRHGYDLFKSGIVKASVSLNDRDLCLDGSSTYVFIPNKFCRFKITSFVPSDICLLLQQKGNHTLEEVEEKLNFNSKLELPPSPSFLGVELLSLLKGNYKIKITIFSEGEMIVQFTIPSNYTSIQMGL